MYWLCGGPNSGDPFGDPFHSGAGLRVNSLVIEHSSGRLVNAAGAGAEVPVYDILLRFRLENCNWPEIMECQTPGCRLE